jgi:predicted alpha/beta hydrolase family esterase
MPTPQGLAYKQVVIVPGWKGSGATHWQRWLERKCRALGAEVHCPKLPGRFKKPQLSAWLEALERVAPIINETTALVGHSLGCPTILHMLERDYVRSVGLVVLVAPVTASRMIEHVDKYPSSEAFQAMMSFQDGLGRATWKARRIEIFTSFDDIWVDPVETMRYAQVTGANFTGITNGGHLSMADGYHTFPWVLDQLKK